MPLSPDSLQQVIKALSKRLLKEENLLIRLEAAKSLGLLSSEKAIPILCQALEVEKDVDVIKAIMDAIVVINNKSYSPMSDSKYTFINPQNVQINEKGDGSINNYASPQNIAAAQEIQKLIQQLQQEYPTVAEGILVEEELVKKDPLDISTV